jgi:hypothetical protein
VSPWPGRRTGSGWCWRSLVQVGGGGPRQAARPRRPPAVVPARRSGLVARRDRPCSHQRGSGALRVRCPGFSRLTALAGTTAGLPSATRTPAPSPAAYPRQLPAATVPPGFLSQQWTHDGSRARQGGPFMPITLQCGDGPGQPFLRYMGRSVSMAGIGPGARANWMFIGGLYNELRQGRRPEN